MKKMMKELGLLVLLIAIPTILIVVLFRFIEGPGNVATELTYNAAETRPVESPNSVEESRPVQRLGAAKNEPIVWAGLTIRKTGAELKLANRVVVLLHGLGDSGAAFSRVGDFLTMDDETCFVFPDAPIKLRQGNAWFRGPQTYQPSRDKVVELLTYIKNENPTVDIVLGGFSQGAMMSSNFLEKDVELLSAIILLAPSGQLRDDVTGQAKVKPPVFLSHGRTDRVLPFQGSEQLHEKLVQHDYPVEWVPFNDGHTVPLDILAKVDQFLIRTKAKAEKEVSN